MKRILLLTVIGTTLLLFAAPGAWAFGVKDVLKMNHAGIADSLIILKIENSGKVFHLSADDIKTLQENDVTDEVISAMLRTEGRDRYDEYGYDNGYYYHPYPYYSYPYSRFGLGFGYYGGYGGRYSHRYGGYYTPRYRPYGSTPYTGSGTTQRYRGSYGSRMSGGGSGQYQPAPAPSGGSTSGGSRPSG